jgi:hypothetical protein
MIKYIYTRLISKILVLLVLFVLLFSTSCTSFFQKRAEINYTVENTTTVVIKLFKDEASAIKAMIFASDNGYSPKQIVKSIHEGTLSIKGMIKNTKPARKKQDFFSYSAESKYALKYPEILLALNPKEQEKRASIDDILSFILESNTKDSLARRWVSWTAMAISEGYSSKQIYDQLNSTESSSLEPPWTLYNGKPYAVVFDSSRNSVITPKFAEADEWPFQKKKEEKVDEFLDSLANDASDLLIGAGGLFDGNKKREPRQSNARPKVKFEDREYKLIPYYANPKKSKDWQVSKHDINFKIKVNKELSSKNVTYFEVYGSFLIETINTNDLDSEKDIRWLIEGQISPPNNPGTTDLLYVNKAYYKKTRYRDRKLNGKNAAGKFTAKLYIGGELNLEKTFVGVLHGRMNENLDVLNNGMLEVDSGLYLYSLPYNLKIGVSP